MRVSLSVLGIALALLLAEGCTQAREAVPPVRYPAVSAGIVDARGRFREIHCAINAEQGARFPDFRECAEALSMLGVEPAGSGKPVVSAVAANTTLVFIPGIFGECVRHLATPFSESYAALRAQGYQVIVVPALGRASSEANAAIIDRTLRARERPNDRLIVFGYSKGTSDFLEALDRFQNAEWISRTRAFVSVAGVVSGTPVADEFEGAWDTLLAQIPLARCAPEDGGGVTSLTRRQRMAWLAAHSPPQSIKYFSIAAWPSTVAANPLFAGFRVRLAAFDSRNDGQMLIEDTVLPRAHLLGYANADHWAIALPFNRSDNAGALPFSIANAYPREVLLRAILSYVEETLSGP
jgi:hypothetical protein